MQRVCALKQWLLHLRVAICGAWKQLGHRQAMSGRAWAVPGSSDGVSHVPAASSKMGHFPADGGHRHRTCCLPVSEELADQNVEQLDCQVRLALATVVTIARELKSGDRE